MVLGLSRTLNDCILSTPCCFTSRFDYFLALDQRFEFWDVDGFCMDLCGEVARRVSFIRGVYGTSNPAPSKTDGDRIWSQHNGNVDSWLLVFSGPAKFNHNYTLKSVCDTIWWYCNFMWVVCSYANTFRDSTVLFFWVLVRLEIMEAFKFRALPTRTVVSWYSLYVTSNFLDQAYHQYGCDLLIVNVLILNEVLYVVVLVPVDIVYPNIEQYVCMWKFAYVCTRTCKHAFVPWPGHSYYDHTSNNTPGCMHIDTGPPKQHWR